MVSFLCRDDECIVRKPEVDAGLWHNIGLELRDVNIQYVIKSQRSGEQGTDLCQQAV